METKTALDQKFDSQSVEARISKEWLDKKAFAAGVNAKREETFSMMLPPPNVTGVLHMGHAFNHTLMDIMVRWHRMRGFDTLWQPGQDHAGIATQMVVERELAKEGAPKRSEMGREAFLEKVWEWKEKSGGTIIEQMKRLGDSCDWDRNRFTMDEGFHDAVLKVFVEMYNKGLIYRGKRLVNWDPHFETAISDLEVESTEVDGHMWHFKYPLAGGATYTYVEKDEDGNITLSEERDYIAIATTRPETMLGDGAVAVHTSDERYASIVGKLCEIPVGPKAQRRLIPIITDEYPDKNFGSGAVKITGAHDFNDYQVAKRNGIPLYALMDTKGAMRADGLPYVEAASRAQAISEGAPAPDDVTEINLVPEDYRGLDRFDARKKVIADITAEGLAVMTTAMVKDEEGAEVETIVPFVENKKIMQPFGDRSKVVIEPMLTDQWFVDTSKIVEPALEAVRSGKTKIIPEQHEKVYYHWLENIEPWCISRQLWWGHQVPVWYGPTLKENKSIKLDAEEALDFKHLHAFCAHTFDDVMKQAKLYYRDIDLVIDDDKIYFGDGMGLRSYSENKAGGGSFDQKLTMSLKRDPDVLDTWFSSGLWTFGTLGWPEKTEELAKYHPTSTLITGFDIIFFWVARMMMMTLENTGEIPFETVYVHPLVRDEKGKKMSKSLGNVLDPLELIDQYGADAVRFTLAAMAAMGRDLKLSVSRIEGYRNFGTKLWNAAKYAQMNECDFNAPFDPSTARASVNKWIIGEVAKARVAHDEALDAYRFNDGANGLYAFTWNKLCDWYIEFAKPLLGGDDEALKFETRATLAWAIDQAVIMLHPVMPFITEELWGSLGNRDNMLVHQDWPEYGLELVDAASDAEMNWVINLIERVRSTRAELHVNAGAKLVLQQVELDDVHQGYLDRNLAIVQRLARIETINVVSASDKGAVIIPVEGGQFALPLAGVIDVAAEIARLDKSIEKLTKEIGGLSGRLKNPNFVASAPEEVVAESQARVVEATDELEKLQAAKLRMAELA